MVRSHGGDGAEDHNPFIDGDPARGLNENVLDQWEEWFDRMEANDILIYLFFYDDGANPWRVGRREADAVPPAEREFVETIVRRFKHHPNLIWLVGEESEEAYSGERVRNIAEIIAAADEHGHLIGNHHHSGTTFKAWQAGCALDHYSMQLNGDLEEAHRGAIRAVAAADGRYLYTDQAGLVGLQDFPAGDWVLHWLDCDTGGVADETIVSTGGAVRWNRPKGFSDRCAVSVHREP